MEMGGVVFIDRANSKNAIDAISPLVDAMRNDRKCVVLAPEGTRTVSPKLAPFKKGAFHMAMQAGVPMIPIVKVSTNTKTFVMRDMRIAYAFLCNPSGVAVE